MGEVEKEDGRNDDSGWVAYSMRYPSDESIKYEGIVVPCSFGRGLDLSFHPDYDQLVEAIERVTAYLSSDEEPVLNKNEKLDLVTSTQPFSVWEDFENEEHSLPKNAAPLALLKRVIATGYLKATWAFREGRPTIYGHRAVCSFADIPLYALLDYATSEDSSKSALAYGIAFDRQELSNAGAHRAIHGLSLLGRQELDAGWTTNLYGIEMNEQYRYVHARDQDRNGDYGDREWRWPFDKDKCICPGLPILLKEPHYDFSKVLVFVPTKNEADAVLNYLKIVHDAEYLYCGEWLYDLERLRNVRVLALDDLKNEFDEKSLSTIQFDDVPNHLMRGFVNARPSPNAIGRVMVAVSEARLAALEAGDFFRRTFSADYGFPDYGLAALVCMSSQSEFISALEDLADELGVRLTPCNDAYLIGYRIDGIDPLEATSRGTVQEGVAVVQAVIKTLNEYFPDVQFSLKEFPT